jgi:tetratricopeptide (TPR) repeat protein
VISRLFRSHRRWVRWLLGVSLGIVLPGLTVCAGANAWAYYQLRDARRDLERQHLRSAREHLRLCRKIWGKDLEVSFLSARSARRAGDLVEAGRILDTLEKSNDLADGVKLERYLFTAHGGNLQVLNSFWPLIDADHPESCMMLEAACHGYAKHKRWPETLLAAYKLTKRQPDNPIGWYWLGYVRDETHEIGAARECYQRALELDPENDEARLRLAFTLLSLNAFEEAADHFERLRARAPGNTGLLGGLAACRRCLGQYDEAFEILDPLLQAAPQLTPALAERGRLALDLGEPAEAEPWLRRALDNNANDSETVYTLFLCLSQQGKTREAAEVDARLQRLDKQERRVRELYKAIVRSPRVLEPRCELGALLLNLGRKQEGLSMLTNILQENPKHRATHVALADFYQQAGDANLAQRHRQAAADGDKVALSNTATSKK